MYQSHFEIEYMFFFFESHCSYYSNEVDNYGSPYGYSQSVATPQTIGYDISADFVDSTTAYEPRNNTIIDADFIGMHSTYPLPKPHHHIYTHTHPYRNQTHSLSFRRIFSRFNFSQIIFVLFRSFVCSLIAFWRVSFASSLYSTSMYITFVIQFIVLFIVSIQSTHSSISIEQFMAQF